MVSPAPLLALYPRAWRERYGDELAALLEDTGIGPRTILDVLLGAFDAHIRQHASDRAAARAQDALIAGGKVTMGTTNLPGLVRFARGKVRDIYAVGDDRLFVVSTDRVSAFDVVMPNPIPDRGKVLTQLSTFWFRQTGHLIPNHLIADDVAEFPESVRAHPEQVEGRAMLVRRAKRIDIECVARGYISGSAWSEYRKQGTACGIRLPEGLVESQQLPEPIFTPATKADTGHDENISFDRLVEIVGGPLAEQLRDVTLRVYT